MSIGLELAGAIGITAIAAAGFLRAAASKKAPEASGDQTPVRVTSGEVELVRPNAGTVEGLEIRYAEDSLVRAVQVGAMNCEHKELLMIMDEVRWRGLANAQKQEVLAAARSTWALKMCGDGPDIAYVVMKTEHGEVVGRADPRSVTVL